MRTLTCATLATILAVPVAHAQQVQGESSTNNPQATTPIAGVDTAALARTARVSKLIGSRVYQSDVSVGQIEDLLVDLESNLIAVVLSVGGFLGVGNKLVVVPVNEIKVGAEAKFTTDLTKEQISNAPAFDFGRLQ